MRAFFTRLALIAEAQGAHGAAPAEDGFSLPLLPEPSTEEIRGLLGQARPEADEPRGEAQ